MDHECLRSEEWTALKASVKASEDRLHKGDLMMQQLSILCTDTNVKMGLLKESHDRVSKRLFIDNGTVSFQTRIDRMDSVIKVAIWLAGINATCIIGLVLTAVFNHFVGGSDVSVH